MRRLSSIPPRTSTGGDDNIRLRVADPVRFRGRRVSGQMSEQDDAWKPTEFKKLPPKKKIYGPKVKLRESKVSLEVFEEKDCVKVIGDMPGVEVKDIHCELNDGILKIHTTGEGRYEGEVGISVPLGGDFGVNSNNGVVEINFKK
ncbi:MAG: Hsp20/alpha crystallin family protein [Candidatus Marinimicrobia bacterium]|nr:Hsp20/alpha crystallin family protein [Candidatus Neomarinimicrobiota bacterium]